MSLFGAGIPLVLIIIFCLLAIFAYFLFRTTGKQKYNKSNQGIYFKIGLYICVLIISLGIVLLFPMEQEIVETNDYDLKSIPSLHAMAHHEKLQDSAQEFLVYQQEFPFQENLLNIRSVINDSRWFTIYVFIEEKSNDDSTIEVSLYQTPTIYDEIDITSYIKPYQIKLDANVLAIKAKENSLSYAVFRTEFPFGQFEKDRQPMFEEEIHAGEQLVYLRIPKNVQIYADEEINLFYSK